MGEELFGKGKKEAHVWAHTGGRDCSMSSVRREQRVRMMRSDRGYVWYAARSALTTDLQANNQQQQ